MEDQPIASSVFSAFGGFVASNGKHCLRPVHASDEVASLRKGQGMTAAATSQVKDALYWSGGEPAEDLLQEVALRLIVLLLVKNVVILSVALKCHSCSSARYQPASPCADKTPCSWQRRTTSGTE